MSILVIVPTLRCNLNCRMCKDRRYVGKEVDLKPILKGMKVDNLTITGGEPTMKERIVELTEFILENVEFYKINFCSNFTLYDKIKEIAELDNKIEFSASIDGLEGTHNFIRRKKCFNLTINNIEKFKQHFNNILTVNFTITPDNYKKIIDVYELTKRLGVHFTFGFATPINYELERNRIVEDFNFILADIKKRCKWKKHSYYSFFKYYEERIMNFYLTRKNKCSAGQGYRVLGPDGKFYPCFTFMYHKKKKCENCYESCSYIGSLSKFNLLKNYFKAII